MPKYRKYRSIFLIIGVLWDSYKIYRKNRKYIGVLGSLVLFSYTYLLSSNHTPYVTSNHRTLNSLFRYEFTEV